MVLRLYLPSTPLAWGHQKDGQEKNSLTSIFDGISVSGNLRKIIFEMGPIISFLRSKRSQDEGLVGLAI